jgi:2-keto-4-pentenoate hydratase
MRFVELVEPQLEIEILFALKSDLDAPDITVERILDATEYVAPAFEIIEARTLPAGRRMNDTVADNHSFGACLIGARKIKPAFAEIGAQTVTVYKSTVPIQAGDFKDVMGSPVHSMLWLAKRMIERNTPLMAGDLVLSGSAVAPIPVAPGDSFTARYATFGENAVRFV